MIFAFNAHGLIVIESSELEEMFKDHLVQHPCNEQGHLQLDSGH